jgi:hypothetical protein
MTYSWFDIVNWNFKIFDGLISKKINSSEIKLKSLSYAISIDNCDSFNIGSLSSFKKGSLKINGYSCVVYIKNDNSGSQRWHFYNCKTLKSHSNYDKRYVATRDCSGLFLLERGKRKALKVCENCLSQSGMKDKYRDYLKGKKNYELVNKSFLPLVLNKSLKAKSNLVLEPHLRNCELSGYVADWPYISYKYRLSMNWACEECNVNLSKNRNLLHTHHIDMNKKNNDRSNFKALCVSCHSMQPGHGHMLKRFSIELAKLSSLKGE